MIKNHQKFRMIDQRKVNDFFTEVNWKEEDLLTNDCKIIKFTFPNGKEAYIERKHLMEMLFVIGAPDEQIKMIPQTIRRSRHYETILGITATKDIKKGEKINVRVKIALPTVEEEVIAEMKRDQKIIRAAALDRLRPTN